MSNLTDTQILVIEDEPDLRAGLQHNLELEGYKVSAAADGRRRRASCSGCFAGSPSAFL